MLAEPEIRMPRSEIPWVPEPQSPLFRKIAQQAAGWQANPLVPLSVGGMATPNVSYVEPPVASSTYSAQALLNRGR